MKTPHLHFTLKSSTLHKMNKSNASLLGHMYAPLIGRRTPKLKGDVCFALMTYILTAHCFQQRLMMCNHPKDLLISY